MLFAPSLVGQDASTYTQSIQVSLGISHSRLIDEAFTNNRLKFSGTTPTLLLGYTSLTDSKLFSVQLEGSTGKVKIQGNKLPTNLHHLQLAASYGRKVKNYELLGILHQLYAGLHLQTLNYVIEDLDVTEDVSLNFFHTLGLVIHQISQLDEKNSIQLSLVLPIMGLTKRDNYGGGINQQLESDFEDNLGGFLFRETTFAAFFPWELPQFHINYSRLLSPKSVLAVDYEFSFVKSDEIAPLNLYNNRLLLGLQFKF